MMMRPGLVVWTKVIGGVVASVLWGLFFSNLARVGKWIFDSTFDHRYRAMSDLEARYRDSQTILAHHSLYAIHIETSTYPPIMAYLFVPFHAIGLSATMTVWAIGNMFALALMFAVTLRRWFNVSAVNAWFVSAAGLAPAAVFAFYPYRSLLLWGQVGVFLALLVFLDLFVMPRAFRGVLIGVATAIKLLPVLFLVWFMAKREIPSILRSLGGFAVLTLLAAGLWPHESAEYWFHVLPSGRVGQVTTVAASHWMRGVGRLSDQSLRGLLGRPPFLLPHTLPWLPIALVVLGVGLLITIRFIKEDRELAAFVLLSLVTVIVSPVSWLHYWVFVGLAPFLALLEWRRDRRLAISSIVLALCTCADLEQKTLNGVAVGTMSPVILFVVRNLYVLGGLQFMVVCAQCVFRNSAVGRHQVEPLPT